MDDSGPKEEGMSTTETETTAAASTTPVSGERYVYSFGNGHADGSGAMKDVLGGKGAGLAEMTNAGVPVPPGFTITTAVCRTTTARRASCPTASRRSRTRGSRSSNARSASASATRAIPAGVGALGAKFSMPGMMDTILNLGLNDRSVRALASRTGNDRFAWDCYRRFIQMFSSGGDGPGQERVRAPDRGAQAQAQGQARHRADRRDLESLVGEFKRHVRKRKNRDFPQDAREQLAMARDACSVRGRTIAPSTTAARTASRTTSAPP
jgi:pyruvate,orthophosphate dikinase